MQQAHEEFMRAALADAEKSGRTVGRPIGAVVVREAAVLGRSGDRREALIDPTAHAEVLAIRRAARTLGRADLSGCLLYTTLEPCPMCCGAILISKIAVVVVGAVHEPDEGRPVEHSAERLLAAAGWDTGTRLVTGVLAGECEAVRRRWTG